MSKLCRNYVKIMSKLCQNYVKIMSKLCHMSKLSKLCQSYDYWTSRTSIFAGCPNRNAHFLKLKGEPKRAFQGTILERKLVLENHQKSLSSSIGIGRGLERLDEQDSRGSAAAQEYLKILQNRRYEITIEDRSPLGVWHALGPWPGEFGWQKKKNMNSQSPLQKTYKHKCAQI